MRVRFALCVGFIVVNLAGLSVDRARAADPFAAMNEAGAAFETQGLDAVIAILQTAIDETRVDGKADPAMAPAFGMLADALRNSGKAEEALRFVEEGLALAAEGNADPLAVPMLSISRAYALADLGRYVEAVETASKGLPPYREAFGPEAGATLEAEIARWVDANRNQFADKAVAAWVEADRLESEGGAKGLKAALPLRREVVRLYDAAGSFPKSLASALAALAASASAFGELVEAREAGVRAIGMVDVLKNEPMELASLFLIVANVFYNQQRHDLAADLQARAILLYATGEDADDALPRFVDQVAKGVKPFVAIDTDDSMRPLLRRALIEFGDTCRQVHWLRLAGDAYLRASQLVPKGDADMASTIAVRFAATAAAGGEPELAREALDEALRLARDGGDAYWIDLLGFWSARIDIGRGEAAEVRLQDAARRLLATLDLADPNAIRLRLELIRSLRQSPAERRDANAILAASHSAVEGVVSRLAQSDGEISSDGDLDRRNAREIFSLFVSAAWDVGGVSAQGPGR